MARETFEAQAAAIRTVLRTGKIIPSDRQLLQRVEQTLLALAQLRIKCLGGPGELTDEAFSDELCMEIVRILRLPTDE